MSKARNWEIVSPDKLREPPLVCLEAHPGPVTFSRRAPLGALRSSLRRYRDLRLPIPMVLMPVDQTGCAWLLPLLCHEVGHNVDQDLQLSSELTKALLLGTDGKIPSVRQDIWYGWSKEILADAFGVLLGNAGFALALASLLLVLAPGSLQQEYDRSDPHPHPAVRVPLVLAMLRRLGATSLSDVIGRIEEDLRGVQAPPWAAAFVDDLDAIAATFLEAKVGALGGRAVRELHAEVAADLRRVRPLEGFLMSGELRPSPDKPSYYPYRLVPIAAQLAIGRDASPAQLDAVQARAMDFIAAIPRPPMLAGAAPLSPRRAAFYSQCARSLDFAGEGQ
jgi:hypothetical protein